jgi:hypothetical protein
LVLTALEIEGEGVVGLQMRSCSADVPAEQVLVGELLVVLEGVEELPL